MVKKDVKVSYYRKRNRDLSLAFKVEELFATAMILKSYFKLWVWLTKWRLFIDSSKRSLKAVLLYIGNQKPSIPIAHSAS